MQLLALEGEAHGAFIWLRDESTQRLRKFSASGSGVRLIKITFSAGRRHRDPDGPQHPSRV